MKKVIFHHLEDAFGVKHPYVRIVRINGNNVLQQSISLARYLARKVDIGLKV